MKVLDPSTVSVEKLALAGRNWRRAKVAGGAAGAAATAAILVFGVPNSSFLADWGAPVISIAFAFAYRLTFEIAMKVCGRTKGTPAANVTLGAYYTLGNKTP
jgi:Na+/proline symporter